MAKKIIVGSLVSILALILIILAVLLFYFPKYLLDDSRVTLSKAFESFDDSARLAGVCSDDPTFHGWGNKDKENRIDYILVSKDTFNVYEYIVHNNLHDGIFASDHYPISIKVRFK